MASQALPSPEVLRQLLRCEPETGNLFWRERPVEMFMQERDATAWNNKFAGREAFATAHNGGYRMGVVLYCRLLAHRVIWAMEYDCWPTGEIDHVNGVRSDNRLSNLRDVTATQNMRNQKIPMTNTSGVIGVVWSKERMKWQAQIMVAKRLVNLGRFTEFDDAVVARKAAEQAYGFHHNHGMR